MKARYWIKEPAWIIPVIFSTVLLVLGVREASLFLAPCVGIFLATGFFDGWRYFPKAKDINND